VRTVHTSQNCSDSILAGDLNLGSALVFFEHGFAGLNLFMLLTFAYVMVNYYDSSIPGLGFSIIKGRQQERQGRCASSGVRRLCGVARFRNEGVSL
jgi:hypothetical protein